MSDATDAGAVRVDSATLTQRLRGAVAEIIDGCDRSVAGVDRDLRVGPVDATLTPTCNGACEEAAKICDKERHTASLATGSVTADLLAYRIRAHCAANHQRQKGE